MISSWRRSMRQGAGQPPDPLEITSVRQMATRVASSKTDGRLLAALPDQRAGADGRHRIERGLRGVDVSHNPFFVDDKRVTAGHAVGFVEHANLAAVLSLGIAQEREIELHLLAKRGIRPGGID